MKNSNKNLEKYKILNSIFIHQNWYSKFNKSNQVRHTIQLYGANIELV